MRVAALYDIHGNLPALEAVLTHVRRASVDLIVIGGDVFPGPMPRETLACLRAIEQPVRFIRGNGDRVVAMMSRGEEPAEVPPSYRAPIAWVAAQLDADDAGAIDAWPATERVSVDGVGEVLFCHATPGNDTEIFTALTDEAKLLPVFASATADVVVCGHTHMQFDRRVGDVRVVNAGSVGMPFDEAGAYWLLLGPEIQLQRTTYDLEAAATRVRATAYPGAEEFAQRHILHPPSARETAEQFSKIELR